MIIDSHVHFFDPSRPEGVPWPNPDDEVLYRTVLPEHYKAVAVPEGVTGTVVVEASEWLEDNAWILDLAENEPFIVGFVGNLQPESEEFSRNLDRFAENPLFRGIRPRGMDVENVEQASVLAGIEQLGAKDLELDWMASPDNLPATSSLAKRLPELRIVINHIAGVFIDGDKPDSTWTEGIESAAEHPNVYCKVSGLVSGTQQIPAPTDASFYAPTIDVLWEAFGEDRLIYGSDWPVSARFAEYPIVQRIVAEYFEAKGKEAAEKYFWRNSKDAYKWIDR